MKQRHFLDFEFSEGFFKPIWWLPAWGFNKKRWSIELISIGIKCEDGRRYFAVNENFDERKCNDWVKENVLPHLPPRIQSIEHVPSDAFDLQPMYFAVQNPQWKSLKEIKENILKFTQGYDPIFYGYFSDYDWVLFCTIFGTMIDLPKNFPMYCIDLKQEFDNIVRGMAETQSKLFGRTHRDTPDEFKARLENISKQLKASINYPAQVKEHDAQCDAEWNFELFKFLNIANL